ncbi:MAG TPA: A24 family peptidase, partial [Gammaproteobacteria bacterium]|nr:A24 family peptidase [Gammaproteobacteria bacterium]
MEWIQNIQYNIFLLLTLSALFGLMIGSFLNVAIYRLPIMLQSEWITECTSFLKDYYSRNQPQKDVPEYTPEKSMNLAWPSSFCPHCKTPLKLRENIPIISFLWQRGRCNHCATKIDWRYPLVEIVCAIATTITVWEFGVNWICWLALLLTWSLIVLSFIDFEHQILPDNITLPFLWFGLFLNAFLVFTTPNNAIIGTIAGYLSLWCVYQLFKFFTGKEGMGYGDFKLMALLGAWLGWQLLPLIIVLSSFLGVIIGLSLILFKGHD